MVSMTDQVSYKYLLSIAEELKIIVYGVIVSGLHADLGVFGVLLKSSYTRIHQHIPNRLMRNVHVLIFA